MTTPTAERLLAEARRRRTTDGKLADRRRLRGHVGTPGERFVDSHTYALWAIRCQESGDAMRQPFSGVVQLRTGLNLRALDSHIITPLGNDGSQPGDTAHEGAARVVGLVPRTTPLLAYVDVIPTTTDLVVDVSETTRTTAAGQADHGFALPESTSFTVTPTQLRPSPWGTWGQAAKGALADSAYAAKTIDRLFRGTFLRALEAQILAGDGSDVAGVRQLVGVLNTPGVVVTPRGATTNIDAIATAVASVQTAEFSLDAPPVVAVAPATHKIIHTSKDAENGYLRVADALGQPVVWHLSNSVPAGTAVVGDFSAARLWVRDFDPIREDGGLRIEVSDQHQDYFIKGLVALRLAADLTFRVALPAAFQVVTGLS